MQQNEIDNILASVKAPLDHPLFYPRIFSLAAKQRHVKQAATDELFLAVTEEYDELSRHVDRSKIQESCSVRNVLRTRQLAKLFIDDKGDIQFSLISKAISFLKVHLYSLGPQRQYDSKRQEHILNVLQLLNSEKEFIRLIKKIGRPLSNKLAEELIKQSLQLSPTTTVTDAHTKQAVLSAWLCTLRQNVGSCFATAPAEIIHDEQPLLFLQDLHNLIAIGCLNRIFGGIENSVPLSSSWGSGDLNKPLFIQISSKGMFPEIWYSPGLIAAFEAVNFLNPNDPLMQKVQQLEEWIKPLIQKKRISFFCITTPEELIRTILLQSLGITEKELKEYENRPKTMVHMPLSMQFPPSGKNTGTGDRFSQFLTLFAIAKNAFKSLADNALLKAWEFTLASYSDIKYEFGKWNFYSSLGLGTNEPDGIGQCIYQTIQNKLDRANKKVQEIQAEYEMVYTQVKTLESRMRHASTEKEMQWLKIDYQSRVNEFYFLEEQRDEAQKQSSALVNLYDILYKIYVDLFQDYFQEVYDADMQEVTANPFDDSPAGFRLLYKHGRTNPSLWTLIKNQHDFIDALSAFFVATEFQIANMLKEKQIERDLSEVITAIIHQIKTKEFLESAFHRMAIAHRTPAIKDPLEHLEQIEKKPWAYTSGGTMNTLVGCYYRIEEKPKEIEKWVENEMELLVFFTDTVKQIPPQFLDPYLKKKRHSILMQSPTHAFLFKPMLLPFGETWSNDEFTYTFIRDRLIHPTQMFIERLLLNDAMLQFLVQQLSEKIHENYLPRFKAVFEHIEGPLNPIFFRDYLTDKLDHDRGLHHGQRPILSTDDIDSFLYSHLPLCPIHELKERLSIIFDLLPGISSEKIQLILRLVDDIPLSRRQLYLGAQQLQEICKALLCLVEIKTSTSEDYHLHISSATQKLGFSMPPPIIFADTNWVKDMFGFVVNPGTGKLELWRVDHIGSYGTPMSSWKQWVDGSRSDLKWSIYVKPFQYGQS